jgi:hypothetical protein
MLVADIFREVEEEVRRERYEQLWKKYRDHIIAAAALVVIGAAGVQLYRVYEQRQEEKASVAYAAAMQLVNSGQPAAAIPQLENLARTAPAGYARIAKLAQADALFAAGSQGAAVRLYQQIASSNDSYLSAVARLHAAWAISDGSSKSDVQSLLGPLTDPGNPWRQMAQEVLAYRDLRSGDAAAALKTYEELAADANAPASLRSRARALALFLKAGGDANYGTVPAPKPIALPPQAAKNPAAAPVR